MSRVTSQELQVKSEKSRVTTQVWQVKSDEWLIVASYTEDWLKNNICLRLANPC